MKKLELFHFLPTMAPLSASLAVYYKALMKLSPQGEADFELDFHLVELQFPLSSSELYFHLENTRQLKILSTNRVP